MNKNSKEYYDSEQYFIDKRNRVLEKIATICNAFDIKSFDYEIDYNKNPKCPPEHLVLEGQKIGCGGNSVSAIIDELIGYIFITRYCCNRSLGVFSTQVQNVIKYYWVKENE